MVFPIGFFRVKDRSMLPKIKENDFLLVSSIHSALKEGDVVVLQHPMKDIRIVKRIEKLVGDAYFVRGDNVQESEDSRAFGTVSKRDIVGKVVLIV